MCLLFVFDDVIDYVIIYELVYCIEMNYLFWFWKLVFDVMFDYKEKEKWLKVYGGKLGF